MHNRACYRRRALQVDAAVTEADAFALKHIDGTG
jgi:hypothetical protein